MGGWITKSDGLVVNIQFYHYSFLRFNLLVLLFYYIIHW